MRRTRVDWDRVRDRLRSNEQTLEEAGSGNTERIDAVYRLRAARLAKGRTEQGQHIGGLPVLVVLLGLERYAIEIKEVAEVFRLECCARVPGSLALFAGVVNLRGELRAVVDLAQLLGLRDKLLALPDGVNPPGTYGDSGFVVLLRRRSHEIGLKVDRIEEVGEIRHGELSPLSQGKYVIGLAPGAPMLLSVDKVLAEVFAKEEV